MNRKPGIHTEVGGDAGRRVSRAARLLKGWVRSATGDVANEAGRHIKTRFLRGQALNYITGTTHDSLRQWFIPRDGSWWIRPGVGIPGSLNYLAKWIGTEHEFMQPGFKDFLAGRDVGMDIIKKIERRL